MLVNKVSIQGDLPIGSLGYGLYGLSGAYGDKFEESEMIDIISFVYELGIRYFDTSNSYGNTEYILGKAVKPFRHNVAIASKVGLGEGNIVDLSRKAIISQCEESLKRLNTDYLDLYQIHYCDPNTPVEETIWALDLLKRQGKIRYYGIGHLPMDKTEEYLQKGHVHSILAEMSPVSTRRYKELSSLLKKYNFKIIAFSITGRGLLSGSIKMDTKFKEEDIRRIDPLFKRNKLYSAMRIQKKLETIGREYGLTSVQMAILWTLEKSGVFLGLTGATNKEHLLENIKALRFKLDEGSIKEIDQFIESEEKSFYEIILEEIKDILNRPSLNIEVEYEDIIYVLEHSIENMLIDYEEGVNLYRKVVGVKECEEKAIAKIDSIKDEIKTKIIAPACLKC